MLWLKTVDPRCLLGQLLLGLLRVRVRVTVVTVTVRVRTSEGMTGVDREGVSLLPVCHTSASHPSMV